MPIPSDVLEATTVAPVEPPLGTGPIVVATDGDEDADAAIRSAWSLAGRTCADVQVLSVVESLVPVVEFGVMLPLPADYWIQTRDTQLEAVRAQLRRTLPQACEWPLTAIEGDGGDAIATYAREQRARLVIMGRGRHGLAHRLVAPEAVLRVLRFSDVPVLAVEPTARPLPRRLVVATDFSPYSTYAARVALSLAAHDATVYFAHVRPRTRLAGPAAVQWERAYAEALPTMFMRVREHVSPAAELQVETVTLIGDPGQALIDFASSSRADLVVSGTHGYGFINRLVLGSVATDLLRGAPCSLLCVRGSAVAHAAARSEAAARAKTSVQAS